MPPAWHSALMNTCTHTPGAWALILLAVCSTAHWTWTQCASSRHLVPRCSGVQVKGTIDVKEFASAHDAEDFLFEFTAEGVGAAQNKFKAVAASLKPQIIEALEAFAQRLHGLEHC